MIIIIFSFFILLLFLDFRKTDSVQFFECIPLFLISILGLFLVTSSFDFFFSYLAIEIQSFCFYVLSSLKRTSEFSTEAGLKYFILGAFSSGFYLFGISLVYGFTGNTSFNFLFEVFNPSFHDVFILNFLKISIFFLLFGILFKIASAPFHFWAPDVYEGSPLIITTFFSTAPKVAMFALLIRICFFCFYHFLFFWQFVLILCSILSLTIGCFAALFQVKIKRLLAYSGITHVGFLLLGLISCSLEGLYSVFFYLIIYCIMTYSFFLILFSVKKLKSLLRMKFIFDFRGLFLTNPMLANSLSIILFSIAGIPPLAGFFSKMFIFSSLIGSQFFFLCFVAIITSLISCFYYIRIIKLNFFDIYFSSLNILKLRKDSSILLSCTSLFLIFFFLYPLPLTYWVHCNIFFFCL